MDSRPGREEEDRGAVSGHGLERGERKWTIVNTLWLAAFVLMIYIIV